MSELIRCDYCQHAVAKEGLVGWLRLERFEMVSTVTWSDRVGPWHFDRAECLEAWAKDYVR